AAQLELVATFVAALSKRPSFRGVFLIKVATKVVRAQLRRFLQTAHSLACGKFSRCRSPKLTHGGRWPTLSGVRLPSIQNWPLDCLYPIVTALEIRNTSNMRVSGQIPLRFLHSLSANFTLPIQKKPLSTVLLPFSLKKVSLNSDKHGRQILQVR